MKTKPLKRKEIYEKYVERGEPISQREYDILTYREPEDKELEPLIEVIAKAVAAMNFWIFWCWLLFGPSLHTTMRGLKGIVTELIPTLLKALWEWIT